MTTRMMIVGGVLLNRVTGRGRLLCLGITGVKADNPADEVNRNSLTPQCPALNLDRWRRFAISITKSINVVGDFAGAATPDC